jgi:hypothetical protein
MFNFSFFRGRVAPGMQATTGFDFGRLLNWRILRGSHEFPGPDGGTCVNEAAIVAAGYPYTPVRRIDDCPPSFSRPLALYAMCLNEIVLDDTLRQELLLPFVARLAGAADTPEVDLQRVALILQRTVAEIVPEAFDWLGRSREARRCRAVTTADEAVAVVKALLGQEWRGARLSGLMSSLSMATEDYLSGRAIDVAQYSGTAIADVAEIIGSVGGRGAAKAAEAVYRRGAAILDGALKIGNKAEPIAPDVVVRRMDTVRQSVASDRRISATVE